MRFSIRHQTRYRYSGPVALEPHLLRFHPREDGAQRVIEYRIDVSPVPAGRNDHIDLEGNRVTQVWFERQTSELTIDVVMQVETLRRNAFDFLLAPMAVSLPVGHEQDLAIARPYLQRPQADAAVDAFAAELSEAAGKDTLGFLNRLNLRLFNDYQQQHRDTGAPQSPAVTLQKRSGACRDLAVLFVDCCRAEGIAARFASGYQRGNLQSERRHLHAWPEVYLPGAGWRGFDPTHGHAVADQHVTIAAAADSRDTMPVTGSFTAAGVTSSLHYEVEIGVSDE